MAKAAKELSPSMTPQEKLELLQQQYLFPVDRWYEDNVFIVEQWKREVMDDDTRLGYMEWLWHRYELLVDEEKTRTNETRGSGKTDSRSNSGVPGKTRRSRGEIRREFDPG